MVTQIGDEYRDLDGFDGLAGTWTGEDPKDFAETQHSAADR
jgi:hypothetical protein